MQVIHYKCCRCGARQSYSDIIDNKSKKRLVVCNKCKRPNVPITPSAMQALLFKEQMFNRMRRAEDGWFLISMHDLQKGNA